MDPETALKRIQTTGSLSISPELFEKIYLSPQNRVAGDLRKTFGKWLHGRLWVNIRSRLLTLLLFYR